jgi:hypothetical protein
MSAHKRPRDDQSMDNTTIPVESYPIVDEMNILPLPISTSSDQLDRQQPHSSIHSSLNASAYVAQLAPDGSNISTDTILIPTQLNVSVSASPSPRGSKKVKLESGSASIPSPSAAHAHVGDTPLTSSANGSNLPPTSPAVVKRSSELVRNEYVARMETFWEDQLAHTQSQSYHIRYIHTHTHTHTHTYIDVRTSCYCVGSKTPVCLFVCTYYLYESIRYCGSDR